ncbi:aminodeoxychorismate/anthranilate synthase component II [Dongshaea marina]|uniref:aminodeoxychorismate/anthranilate synthase component II n=1 Tax=Dongshaea marina TaxID=2047966 RepID=UPI000D3E1119|nr:aminodeoxychorismate/anthranilate synthase component II [Dongshaea marina]
MNCHIFLLDNFDSFTYNLVDQLRILDCEVTIYRNDICPDYLLTQMEQSDKPAVLLLSPGPGHPKDAGCMPELLKKCQGLYPVLGICLGHQAIVEHYGGSVGAAEAIVHGKASLISHQHEAIFANLPNPMQVARYHSLVATQVPKSLEVIAEYQGMPMSALHPIDKMLGLQFHPESIMTARGSELLRQGLEFITREVTQNV